MAIHWPHLSVRWPDVGARRDCRPRALHPFRSDDVIVEVTLGEPRPTRKTHSPRELLQKGWSRRRSRRRCKSANLTSPSIWSLCASQQVRRCTRCQATSGTARADMQRPKRLMLCAACTMHRRVARQICVSAELRCAKTVPRIGGFRDWQAPQVVDFIDL